MRLTSATWSRPAAAAASERLLDDLALRPGDRVVEVGCGPGGFSRRILRRLGEGGVLVGVDCTEGLLSQASAALDDLALRPGDRCWTAAGCWTTWRCGRATAWWRRAGRRRRFP
jgi:cyclopropane fatty-acyl-phospholipid synthase-like methyltransferase